MWFPRTSGEASLLNGTMQALKQASEVLWQVSKIKITYRVSNVSIYGNLQKAVTKIPRKLSVKSSTGTVWKVANAQGCLFVAEVHFDAPFSQTTRSHFCLWMFQAPAARISKAA